MKLIFENWRKYLNESVAVHPNVKKLIDIVMQNNLFIQIEHAPDGGADKASFAYATEEGAIDGQIGDIYEKERTYTGTMIITKSRAEKKRFHPFAGPCGGAWTVDWVRSDKNLGLLLYEVALEWASKEGGGITPDKEIVEPAAMAVWEKYFNERPDIEKKQLDIMAHPGEKSEERTTDGYCETDDDCNPPQERSGKYMQKRKQPKTPHQTSKKFKCNTSINTCQLTPEDPTDDCSQTLSVSDKGWLGWPDSMFAHSYHKNSTPVMDVLGERIRETKGEKFGQKMGGGIMGSPEDVENLANLMAMAQSKGKKQ